MGSPSTRSSSTYITRRITGRTLYRIAITALLDESLSPEALGNLVERVAVTEPTDGLEFDTQGNLYMTAIETNAIKVLRPTVVTRSSPRRPIFCGPTPSR